MLKLVLRICRDLTDLSLNLSDISLKFTRRNYEAIQSNASYQGINAPTSIRVRYVTEDVPTGLVPLMELADIVGVAVPSIRAIVRIANAMLGEQYEKNGRTLLSMGIAGLSAQEIRQRVT